MADIAAVLLGPVLEIVKWVSAPILRQFQYLCCFTANITALNNEACELEVTERDLQAKVDAARNDVRVISHEVETWFRKSNDIKDEKDEIFNQLSNVESGFLKLGARFSLSKRAKKTAYRLKELRGEGKFDSISRPRLPTAAAVLQRTCEFESRKQIEDEIMATLRGDDVNIIGICGMGGLGKTTMATRIMNRALNENVFEEVAMAIVSQFIGELKIQHEIGRLLGLNLKGESSTATVKQKLYARLSGAKRILLVLDDVWTKLDLGELGIPCGHKGCTILLTSRNHDVLNEMYVQKIFGMEVLSEQDSWYLFRKIVGTCVDDNKLNSIAENVVNECKGLPLALKNVGDALKDEVSEDKWKYTLQQLEKSDQDFPIFIAPVYNHLKLSFDVLEPECQHVFLLCCLYPEDADIPLEHLTYFCMGLGILAEGNVEEARNTMCALTEVLISRSLLEDSTRRDEHVRMHDVVRDACIVIAKQKGYIGDNDCKWISSIHRSKLPMGLVVPNLRLLFFRAHRGGFTQLTLDNSFLRGIKDLSVICIEGYSWVSFRHTPHVLQNLNTLILDSCSTVETLSIVGELVNLEILICRDCDSIEELPPELKGLNRLKVLDLTMCKNLQKIGRGILSSLVWLEELKMLGSFKKWEGEDREERDNAGLRELEVLTKLGCLEIEIENTALVAENIHLSSKVDRFTVNFLCAREDKSKFNRYLCKRKLHLNWEGTKCLGYWIEKQLLRDTECLHSTGDWTNKVDLTKLKNIKMLEFGGCESMKNVVTSNDDGGGATAFPFIEHLYLFRLPKLEEIWDYEVWLNCFKNLKELRFSELPALKQLWKTSQNNVGMDILPQLEVLEIHRCEMMDGVFLWKIDDKNENNTRHHITFPKLKTLQLWYLPNLISLCQGIESIDFPLVSNIWIKECSNMKGIVWNGMRRDNENNSEDSRNTTDTHHLFCKSQVSFGCLKELDIDHNPFCCHTVNKSLFYESVELYISKCVGSHSLFTSSIPDNLVNLRVLIIRESDEMVEVIKDDEENGISATALLFPKRQRLELSKLPELVSLCSQSIFYGLKELRMSKCVGSRSLFTSSITRNLVNLRELSISDCDEMVEVIRDDEEKGMSVTALLFPEMHTLELSNLPQLVSFCGWKCDVVLGVEFPLLKEMVIKQCGKMKGMFSNGMRSSTSNATDTNYLFYQQVSFCSHTIFYELKELRISKCVGSPSLFTSSIARNLVNLRELSISDCDEMVEVIRDDEEKGMSVTALLFPELHTLELSNIPELVSFCGWKCDVVLGVEFPLLRAMVIKACGKMEGMFSNGTRNSSSNATETNHVLCQQVSYGCIKELSINWNPFCSHTIHVSQFYGLKELTIWKCAGSRNLYTSSITGNLVNLRELRIEDCDEMVVVIKDDEEKEMISSATALLFPKLQRLKLLNLPQLVSFCGWKCDVVLGVEFPLLREMVIIECGKMKGMFSNGMRSSTSVATDTNYLFYQRVSFCSHTIFCDLEELTISKFVGSRSLFTYSIAMNLVNLRELSINDCDTMVEVIKDDEEIGMSGNTQRTLLFPELHTLKLLNLPKLESFCEWKCDVELPSLSKVYISECPNMKNFSFGPSPDLCHTRCWILENY